MEEHVSALSVVNVVLAGKVQNAERVRIFFEQAILQLCA